MGDQGLDIQQLMGILAAVLVAGMALIEFADRLGLPTPLLKRRQARIKSIITDTLEEVGLLPYRARISALASGLSHKILPNECGADELLPLVKRYQRDKVISVGTSDRKDIKNPIDFMSATSERDDIEELARCLACFILRETSDNREIAYTALATPYNGNVVLAHLTAGLLDRELLLLNPDDTVIADSPVFGKRHRGTNVILIHDVVYTGRRICRAVDSLRMSDMTVNAMFCLVERTDGVAPNQRAAELLSRRDVKAFSLLTLSADDLEADDQALAGG